MADLKEPVLDYIAPPARKTWSVGTLTYTAGGLVILFSWLLWGDFVLQLKEKSVPPALQVLLKNFQATDFVKGALIGTLPNAMAVLLVPVISYRSDRHRGKWGRRIPYLLVPTPLAVISMVGLGFAPALGRWMSELNASGSMSVGQWTVLNLAIFWTLFEVSSIICGTIFTALINDVVPRALLGRFFAMFRIFSLAASMTFTWFLFGQVQERYFAIFVVTALLYGLGFGAMCFFIKEGDYPPPTEEAHVPGAKPHGLVDAVATYFRDCFSHPYYLWYFLSIALAHIAFQPILLFFLDMSIALGMTQTELGRHVQTPQLACSFLLAIPIGWLCDKVHSTRVAMVAIGLYAVGTLLAFLFIRDARTFTIAQIICGTIAGAWSTAYLPMNMVIFPKAEYATFASAMGLVIAVAVMLASSAAGQMLDSLHHQYRYIYLWASVFSLLSLLSMLVVYRKFKRYGGVAGYVAPIPNAKL